MKITIETQVAAELDKVWHVWNNPADISYPAPLGATQLNAGSFRQTPRRLLVRLPTQMRQRGRTIHKTSQRSHSTAARRYRWRS